MSTVPYQSEDSISNRTPTRATFAEDFRLPLRSASSRPPNYPTYQPEEQANYSSEGSETETEMSDRRSEKHREGSKSSSKSSSSKSSSSKSSSSKSSSKSSPKTSKTKSDDWSEVIEPDERRRIQNRIAQRKFREKAKEQKEAKDRDTENQQRAGQIYSSPEPQDMNVDFELSGLPWGSINLRHVVERGKASRRESFQGSPGYEYSSYGYHSGGGSGRGSSDQ